MPCDEQMGCYTYLLRWPVFLKWALRRLGGGGEGGKYPTGGLAVRLLCVGSGLCDVLITLPDETYRLCVCVCVFVSNCVRSRELYIEAV